MAILNILRGEVKPALGVTEPVSVALAAAKAYQTIGGKLKSIRILVDPSLFKNAFFCMIPGTDDFGLELAAVLGVMKGVPEAGMEVLKKVGKKDAGEARALLRDVPVKVSIKSGHIGLHVRAEVTTSRGTGSVLIEKKHDHVTLVKKKGKIVYRAARKSEAGTGSDEFKNLTIADLVHFAGNVPSKEIRFVLDAAEMNSALAREGLRARWGMGAGLQLHALMRKGKLARDAVSRSQINVAAATDARLGGAKLPAMSVAGSGTHALTAVLPIVAMAKQLKIGKEKMTRAIALSLLVTIYMKMFTGRLSAFCGCAVTAGSGAAAGIVMMLGGGEKEIGHAIINMAADVTGIICDGANFGCSLKTSTGAASALKAAFLALNGTVMKAGSGIVGRTVEETIRNMGDLSSKSMDAVNNGILDIMTK